VRISEGRTEGEGKTGGEGNRRRIELLREYVMQM
jgi:hypothetical protein